MVLAKVPEATIVPEQALTNRDDKAGFHGQRGWTIGCLARVKVGIREGGRVQVEGEGLSGRVVTLGQQLLKDGSAITIPEEKREC